MALTQSHFRWGVDSGTESTHGWHAAEDAQFAVPLDTTVLLRFCVQASGGVAHGNTDLQFQFAVNGGAFANVTTSSSPVRAVAAVALTNGGNCTKRLSGTGTFETTGAGQTEDGLSGGTANDIAANGNSETECGLQLLSAGLSNGDVVTFRLTSPDAAIAIGVTPSVTITIAQQSRAQLSWAELEAPTAPRRALAAWAELEAGTAPRRATVTAGEMEGPDVPPPQSRSLVSWAELEAPTAPRRAMVSHAEAESPVAPRRALVTHAEHESPSAPRRITLAWAEAQVPTAPRRSVATWGELETTDAKRRALVSSAEVESPSATQQDSRALVLFAELEAPGSLARRALLRWAEMEVPAPGARATTTRQNIGNIIPSRYIRKRR
jgi:hypothetical protein